MIKINLLSEGRRPTAVRRGAPSGGEGSFLEGENAALLMLVVALVIPVLIAGALWFKFDQDLKAKEAEVAEAQERVDQLQQVLEEVAEFERKRDELEQKIQVINDLKAAQRGPVRVMDSVSRALPELLWLDRMQMGPNQISISGRAFNFNAIANFVENLDEVPEFKEPELRDSTRRGDVFGFTVAFGYDYTEPEPSAEEAEEAAMEDGQARPAVRLAN